MDIYEFPPIRILISAAYWLVTRISELLEPLAGTESAAAAVILLTIAVRIVLIPVGRSQVRAGIIRERLAPQLAELQRRYKKNPELLQRKTMELYASEKSSPFAGCLPVLAQTPLLMAVYGLFIRQTVDGHANELLTHTFLGIPLDAGFIGQIAAGAADWGSALVFVAIMVLIAIVAQASRRLLAPPTPATPAERPDEAPDLSRMMRVLSFMPFLTAAIAAFVPLAAALYLLTTTAWTLGERIILRRVLGGSPGAGEAVAA